MFEQINTTTVFVSIILLVFIYFLYQIIKMFRLYKDLSKTNDSDNVINSLSESKVWTILDDYKKSIIIQTPQGMKTNIPASEFFSELNTCKSQHLNLRLLDTASGTLVGLGLLGTFLGLTLGIEGFDSTSTAHIQKSIQTLLNGMGTAFQTSLVGMLLSLIYTACDKYSRNKLSKALYDLTEKLDHTFYIDDVALASLHQNHLMEGFYQNLQNTIDGLYKNLQSDNTQHTQSILNRIDKQTTDLHPLLTQISNESIKIQSHLKYANENGDEVTLGNAIREILRENSEQSKALKSFSTDLALELSNGFDQVMSRQMQEKILPLMENVDATTRSIIEHIDQMAKSVSSPATDMIGHVVDELKSSMSSIINEFKKGLSDSATNELESLAVQLNSAAQAMTDFPNNMSNISATLQTTIDEVKKAVTDISNTSASTNSTAMQQMQEQLSFATGAINNAIEEVKDVMQNLSQSSQMQSEDMVNKLAKATEQMGNFLNGTVSNLSGSLQESMKSISENLAQTITDLTATSANANNTSVQQMQEQVNFATSAIKTAIDEVKATMQSMTQSSQNQNSEMTQNLINASTKISNFLDGTMSNISSSVQNSMKEITEDVNKKQAELIALQQETTNQTRNLLLKFDQSLARLEQTNENVKGTMNMFQKAQSEITGSTAHLQTITGDMKSATQAFQTSQLEYGNKLETIQKNSQESIHNIGTLLNEAGTLSSDYAEQFAIIKDSLVSIFSQLQSGLNTYSKTVQATTQKYLDQYSSSLTETANILSSSINQQSEVVEMLSEALTHNKR